MLKTRRAPLVSPAVPLSALIQTGRFGDDIHLWKLGQDGRHESADSLPSDFAE
jgi:hypothetical protein